MKKSSLKGLVIRTAAVRRPDLGFLIACDPKKEKKDIPHAIVFRWKVGLFNFGKANFNAHSICLIQKPELGNVFISASGSYAVETRSGLMVGNMFRKSHPPRKRPRYGDLTSLATIGDQAYAVGLCGTAYRLDNLKQWTRIDDGLPETFDMNAIHGFGASDLYGVGYRGQLWRYNGKKWKSCKLPTTQNLSAVHCAGDGKIYIAGHNGMLIRGHKSSWEVIKHKTTTDDIWDLEWFEGQLYVSTRHAVYRLKNDKLEPVDFGKDPPKSCYQLSSAPGVLWSNGSYDVMAFDGKKWKRVV